MPLPGSSIATVCRSVVDFVDARLGEGENPVLTVIGSPADAVPQQADDNHRVNFFFYRVEPAGDTVSLAPDQPWWVRLHCLVTAFATTEGQTSAGENDLRLLGEVLRIFHEAPILPEVAVDGETVRPRVVFQSLSLDELNHLWSTQGDVRLRPSAGYEVALVPVVPSERGIESPLVGALGFEVRTTETPGQAPFAGTAEPPGVVRRRVDTDSDQWAPLICLMDGGSCFESRSFEVGSQELDDFVARVWVAGRVGVGNTVTLRWETWDSTAGWVPQGAETPADPSTDTIDPELAGTAMTETLAMPFDDQAGQLLLYARRDYVRPSDGATLEVRSNPVLLSLYPAEGA